MTENELIAFRNDWLTTLREGDRDHAVCVLNGALGIFLDDFGIKHDDGVEKAKLINELFWQVWHVEYYNRRAEDDTAKEAQELREG